MTCIFVSQHNKYEDLGTSLNIPSTAQNIFQGKLSPVVYDHSFAPPLWRAHNNAFCLPTQRAVLVICPEQMFDCVWGGGRSSEIIKTDRQVSHEKLELRVCRDILSAVLLQAGAFWDINGLCCGEDTDVWINDTEDRGPTIVEIADNCQSITV
jgi:hypothetical protein